MGQSRDTLSTGTGDTGVCPAQALEKAGPCWAILSLSLKHGILGQQSLAGLDFIRSFGLCLSVQLPVSL